MISINNIYDIQENDNNNMFEFVDFSDLIKGNDMSDKIIKKLEIGDVRDVTLVKPLLSFYDYLLNRIITPPPLLRVSGDQDYQIGHDDLVAAVSAYKPKYDFAKQLEIQIGNISDEQTTIIKYVSGFVDGLKYFGENVFHPTLIRTPLHSSIITKSNELLKLTNHSIFERDKPDANRYEKLKYVLKTIDQSEELYSDITEIKSNILKRQNVNKTDTELRTEINNRLNMIKDDITGLFGNPTDGGWFSGIMAAITPTNIDTGDGYRQPDWAEVMRRIRRWIAAVVAISILTGSYISIKKQLAHLIVYYDNTLYTELKRDVVKVPKNYTFMGITIGDASVAEQDIEKEHGEAMATNWKNATVERGKDDYLQAYDNELYDIFMASQNDKTYQNIADISVPGLFTFKLGERMNRSWYGDKIILNPTGTKRIIWANFDTMRSDLNNQSVRIVNRYYDADDGNPSEQLPLDAYMLSVDAALSYSVNPVTGELPPNHYYLGIRFGREDGVIIPVLEKYWDMIVGRQQTPLDPAWIIEQEKQYYDYLKLDEEDSSKFADTRFRAINPLVFKRLKEMNNYLMVMNNPPNVTYDPDLNKSWLVGDDNDPSARRIAEDFLLRRSVSNLESPIIARLAKFRQQSVQQSNTEYKPDITKFIPHDVLLEWGNPLMPSGDPNVPLLTPDPSPLDVVFAEQQKKTTGRLLIDKILRPTSPQMIMILVTVWIIVTLVGAMLLVFVSGDITTATENLVVRDEQIEEIRESGSNGVSLTNQLAVEVDNGLINEMIETAEARQTELSTELNQEREFIKIAGGIYRDW